jgi:hypothetical protein
LSDGQPTSSPPPGAQSPWGGHAGSGPPQARQTSAGDQLDPLARRLLHLAGLLAVLLLGVLANSLLNGGGEEPLDFNPVAAAAERTENCPGERFSMYVVYTSPIFPEPVVATGSGAYNGRTERSRVTLDMNIPPVGPVHVVEIDDGEYEYTSGDMVEDELPPGKEWVRTESGVQEEDELELDTQDAMRMLSSAGGVQLIGREAINGKLTRRYRGDIQVVELVAYLREHDDDEAAAAYEGIEGEAPTGISAEGWVDGKNLLRRFRIVMPSPVESGQPPLMVDVRMDFFDYGAKPVIEAPDPDLVVDGPLDEDEAAATGSFS